MASATNPVPAVNIARITGYPIRIGASLTSPSDRRRFTSVRYNHKPKLDPSATSATATASVKPRPTSNPDAADTSELVLRSGDGGEWTYTGARANTENKTDDDGDDDDDDDEYVLTVRTVDGKTEVVLDKVSTSWAFNLRTSPDEKDAGKLGRTYPQIALGGERSTEDGAFTGEKAGEGEEEVPVDPQNPFDYRNHLDAKTPEKHPPAPASPRRSTLGNGGGVPQTKIATGSTSTSSASKAPPKSATRSTQAPVSQALKKRKGTDPLLNRPKRAKPSEVPDPAKRTSPSSSTSAPKSQQQQHPTGTNLSLPTTTSTTTAIPTLHTPLPSTEANASSSSHHHAGDDDDEEAEAHANASDSDDGALILENASPPRRNPHHNKNFSNPHPPTSMSRALNGHLNTPSLTASSGRANGSGPVSLLSAASSPLAGGGGGGGFGARRGKEEEGEAMEFVFGDSDEEEEVEEVEEDGVGDEGNVEVEDEDDDMAQELARALGAEEDEGGTMAGAAAAVAAAEESEESEEE